MNYTDTGNSELAGADDMNILVNSHLLAPDEESPLWRWRADNFMPRRGTVGEGEYAIEATSKEAILEAVKTFVVPLYEAAVMNLTTRGENYYWEVK